MTSSIILPFGLNVEMRMYHNKAFPLGIIKANIKTYVNYYKIDDNFIPKIDIQFIRQNLENYLLSRKNLNYVSSKKVYGIDVWIELAKYVESAGDILDFRFGRACMEHHGLMLKRIQTLLKNQYTANETIEKEYTDIYIAKQK